MPAHLESTDRAMKAEKARVGQDRRARMDDQETDRSVFSGVIAPASSPRKRWRARVNAAVILKQKKKSSDSDEKGSEN